MQTRQADAPRADRAAQHRQPRQLVGTQAVADVSIQPTALPQPAAAEAGQGALGRMPSNVGSQVSQPVLLFWRRSSQF